MSETRPVVVVIDDDPDIRDALQDLLETVDLDTRLFATASEFLANKRPQGPCCVVVDIRLPGLSGLDFQQQLARENIPIPGHLHHRLRRYSDVGAGNESRSG